MKRKNFKLRSIFLFLLIGFALNAQTELNLQDSVEKIDQLLLITDEIKTSGSPEFTTNMNLLMEQYDVATSSQQQYIDYLKVYEKALDGDFIKVKADYDRLFEQSTDPYIKIRIKATLANIQAISREYSGSLIDLDYAINNVNNIDDEQLKNKVNLISSLVYFLLEIYESSYLYAETVLASDPDQVLSCKAMVYSLRSSIKLKKNITTDSVNETVELCKSNQQMVYAIILEVDWLNSQLDLAHAAQDKNKIAAILKQALAIDQDVEEFGYNNLIGLKDMVIAKAYFFDGQVELAIQSAQKCINGSVQSGNTSQVVEALKILVSYATKNNDFKLAYQYMSQINRVENEIYSEAIAKQMAFMSIKHENLAKQLEIEQLNQSNQLLFLENQLAEESTKKQQLMMMLVISLLVLLAMWTYRIKRKHDYFKKVADIDHLTQVFTRKAFEEKVDVILDNAAANNEQVNLAIMDLDHFKNVNDQFGHLVGDWVLKQVILICEEVADEDVLMSRMGGEEFSIVSPGISQLKMKKLMEKMRHAIEQMDCSASGHDFNITASFGVSSSLQSGYKVSMLLTHADLALFKAKNNGRNLVVAFDDISADDLIEKPTR